ncbi:L,D-transpeptidase family protein [Candidatus Riesia pediculicola]|uniref:L,D-transpeptidase family protein n=1 Tax=Candidatus Riesia pediculicola TaxID=401619 RepID=UPI0009C277FB|nr:L,D-transpeptidase family protein [Candidatus Riesia pediculicola]ARC54122.1 peptidoglycan-binding protein [Candidatus Riesia pediculicola]
MIKNYRKFPIFFKIILSFIFYFPTFSLVFARDYLLNPYGGRLIGKIEKYTVPKKKESLEDIMSRFQVGLLGTLRINPKIDVYLPRPGSQIIIPSQMIIPNLKEDEDILINLAELRLYHFLKKKNIVSVYPVGIGQKEASTPTFEAKIIQMIKKPIWIPTKNIRRRYELEGIKLPEVVPSGIDNPMGMYAMRLSYGKGEYLIHGTNENFGIGSRVTSGCIRLRKEDIKKLFSSVKIGDKVRVINEPIKYSKEPSGDCYIEVHRPISEDNESKNQRSTFKFYEKDPELKKFLKNNKIEEECFLKTVLDCSGIPIKLKMSKN